jgi:hypothetical protein
MPDERYIGIKAAQHLPGCSAENGTRRGPDSRRWRKTANLALGFIALHVIGPNSSPRDARYRRYKRYRSSFLDVCYELQSASP